jgi:hypothetical protein
MAFNDLPFILSIEELIGYYRFPIYMYGKLVKTM